MTQRSDPGRMRFTLGLARRSVGEFLDDRGPQFAASVSFHTLFSLFPLTIGVTALFSIVAHDAAPRQHLIDAIVQRVPASPDGSDRLRRRSASSPRSR